MILHGSHLRIQCFVRHGSNVGRRKRPLRYGTPRLASENGSSEDKANPKPKQRATDGLLATFVSSSSRRKKEGEEEDQYPISPTEKIIYKIILFFILFVEYSIIIIEYSSSSSSARSY